MTWFPPWFRCRLMTQVVHSDRRIFVKRASNRHVYVTEKLQLWSTTRQPCCWVAWVMPWDTGTSCGSTMSLGQPSIRWSWCAVIMPALFSSILKDNHLSGPYRNLKSWVACRTSRLSSLTGRWATTQFCIWRRLRGWQPVSSMQQQTRLAALASVTLLLF